jgi:hypothetical protein
MSFSLPGRKVCSRKHYISRIRDTGIILQTVADTNSAGSESQCVQLILMEVFQSAAAHDTGSRPRYP